MAKLSGKSGRIKIGSAVAITGATATGATVVVTSSLSVAIGDFVLISSVAGMTDLNNSGKAHIVTAKGTGTFTVVLPASTSQTYTSGGTAQIVIPISEWKLDRSLETADVTDSESGDYKEYIVTGHKGWSGSYSGYLSDGQNLPPQGQYAIVLDINATNSLSGNAILTSDSVTVPIPGAAAVQISGTFTGTGALTEA